MELIDKNMIINNENIIITKDLNKILKTSNIYIELDSDIFNILFTEKCGYGKTQYLPMIEDIISSKITFLSYGHIDVIKNKLLLGHKVYLGEDEMNVARQLVLAIKKLKKLIEIDKNK